MSASAEVSNHRRVKGPRSYVAKQHHTSAEAEALHQIERKYLPQAPFGLLAVSVQKQTERTQRTDR